MRVDRKDLPLLRLNMWEAQGRRCGLTGQPLPWDKAVVDHSHVTGRIRAVLHRGVNSLLGKIENNHARLGVPLPLLLHLAPKVYGYMMADYSRNPIYPTHRTASEKAALYKKRAAVRRKKAQQDACK